MNGIADLVKTLGPVRLAAMGAVAAILVAVFAIIILRVTAPQMVPLYTDLAFDDSAAIVSQLESLGVAHEIRQDGAILLVPKDDVFRIRMRLAEQGLPTGGSIGYEIFDKSDTLGATSFVQNINHLRALEGELARTIRAIDRVQMARVHLVIPERQLFQRDRQPATASIVLKVRGSLDQGQVRAIQHLVAAAVEGMTPEHVSIVDESGCLLASGNGEGGEGFVAAALQERSIQIEQRLRRQVEEIVESVVGTGRSRVRVAVELDHNRITETLESFDPESQVVRSTQIREENSSTLSREAGVTAGNQLPEAEAQSGDANRDVASTTEEIINYEISKSTKTEIIEAGGIERLSVAVLVDGVYVPDQDNEMVYQPRTQEELDRIAVLVRSAVGFDQSRGDTVEVVNLRFAEAPNMAPTESVPELFAFDHSDLMRFVELGVLLLVALLLTLFAVRPLVKRFAGIEAPKQPQLISVDGQPSVGPALIEDSASEENKRADVEPRIEWLEEAQAAGAIQIATVSKVGEMIEEYPQEAVNIIRGWLNEAA